MFVSGLDRPWLETPFLLQGFLVRSPEDIEEIKKYCEYVYIDVYKSTVSESEKRTLLAGAFTKRTVQEATPVAGRKNQLERVFSARNSSERIKKLEKIFPNRKLKVYEDQVAAKKELGVAKQIYRELNYCVTELVADVQKGAALNVEQIKGAVDPMIDSVIRNPDACMWLARMKNKDTYTYKHSMGASVWAVALGRQIGLPKVDLKTVALGTLLCDIGKLQLPDGLLNKPGRLSKGEFTMVRSHVELGLEILKESRGITKPVLDIVEHHHERFNGRGYPKKIKGNAIPVLARIAAIADCYDAMTSERCYANAMSPSLAVRKLYEWRGEDFQTELIEEFIQAVGLYPAGTLVELSNGEVAIVVAESRASRLRPQVLILLDKDKQPLEEMVSVDLRQYADEEGDEPVSIVQSLSPGSYDIDPEMVYY